MLDRLPEFIDPLHFVERQSNLEGGIEICEFNRLAELLTSHSGQVDIKMDFYKDHGHALIDGFIKAELHLKCQTCLNPVEWPVELQFKLDVVTSLEQESRLLQGYEPLLVGENKLPLAEIIEDELLLEIPAFPRHTYECGSFNLKKNALNEHDKIQSNTNNPFTVLSELKNNGD